MTAAAMWGRIPEELRALNQWVIAGADKTPLSVDAQGNLYAAKSTDPTHWLPFDIACAHAIAHNAGIGFVLTEADPYTCIDFDVKDASNEPDPSKHTNPDAMWWFWDEVQKWDSYTEMSRNGKGMHVWVQANIGKGRRRFPIEVYSRERYIICTGNIILDRPIRQTPDIIQAWVDKWLPSNDDNATELVEVTQTMTDDGVMKMAWEAENSNNFRELYAGRWHQFGHPSQSEADLALMSMFTFYSKSNEQCRRLFRQSALGQREKAQKNDRYLNYTLTIIRGRQAREKRVDASALLASFDFHASQRALPPPLTVAQPAAAAYIPPTAAVAVTLAGPSPTAIPPQDTGIPWPPGFAGAVADFIYKSAPRPVREVAIVGALGLLAGLCGKAWYIPNSGLNIYLILVARSAVGKEAMHSGISALVRAAAKHTPHIYKFVDFNDFASGPALVKACSANSCFVNVTGEWGRKLQRLSKDDGRDAAMTTLRSQMTNLYQKSGPQAIVGGISYSNKDNNVAAISGVSYSMIGETTPKTFYEALTDTMMEDGFLSRFTVIEYTGQRPELNDQQVREPPEPVAQAVAELARYANQIMAQVGGGIPVHSNQDAAAITKAFELECDVQINSAPEDESWRQMWNRASLKAMRIAALLAVGDNPGQPEVTPAHINWSIDVVRRDIEIMQRKMESGEVGNDDVARERKMIDLLRDYGRNQPAPSYAISTKMWNLGIIPQSYITNRCNQLSVFKHHKMGATEAVKQTLRSLGESGYLKESDRQSLVDNHSYYGKAYMILKLPESHFRKQA